MKRFNLRSRYRRCVRDHLVLVDDEDAYLLRGFTWHVNYIHDLPYVRRLSPGNEAIGLQHDILQLPTSTRIYFANSNGLDCRRENLSLVVPRERVKQQVLTRRLLSAAGCYRPYYSELRP